MRIFTGAPMPDGADTVFMQEDVRLDEAGKVVLPAGLRPGANVRPAGEDIAAGRSALAAGQRLRPQDIALAAAFGLTDLEVRRRIRVAVFSTGNELVSPGARARAAQLFDSNRFMLMAMLVRLGCEVSDLGIVSDDRASLAQGLKKVAGTHDLILTTGGVSTGEEDHVKASVESVGTLVLWRMAIKPGRPVAMGIIARHAVHRTAGKSGGEFCHLCPCGAADGAGAGGRCATHLVPMPVRAAFSLQKEDRPPRICPGQLAQGATTARWKRQSFRARARGYCLRWWTPMAWSNSARRSRRSNLARPLDFCRMRACFDRRPSAVDDASPLRHVPGMTTTKLDLTGLKCPLPALKTRKALKALRPGDVLEVHCTDPLSVIDIPNLIRETGDKVEITERAEQPDRVPDRKDEWPSPAADVALQSAWPHLPSGSETGENRYLLPIDTGPGICPNRGLRRGAEVDSRLWHARSGTGHFSNHGRRRHNVWHQVLGFPNARRDPGASWELCRAAMWELSRLDGLRTTGS